MFHSVLYWFCVFLLNRNLFIPIRSPLEEAETFRNVMPKLLLLYNLWNCITGPTTVNSHAQQLCSEFKVLGHKDLGFCCPSSLLNCPAPSLFPLSIWQVHTQTMATKVLVQPELWTLGADMIHYPMASHLLIWWSLLTKEKPFRSDEWMEWKWPLTVCMCLSSLAVRSLQRLVHVQCEHGQR